MSEIYHWFITSGQSPLFRFGCWYISEHAQKPPITCQECSIPEQIENLRFSIDGWNEAKPPSLPYVGWFLSMLRIFPTVVHEFMPPVRDWMENSDILFWLDFLVFPVFLQSNLIFPDAVR